MMQDTAVCAWVCINCMCATMQSHYDSKLLKDNTFYIEHPLAFSLSVLFSETAQHKNRGNVASTAWHQAGLEPMGDSSVFIYILFFLPFIVYSV